MPALKHRRSATRRPLPTWPVAIRTPRGVVIEQRPVIRRPAPERISPAQDVAPAADLLDDDYREPVEQLLTSFEAEAGKILRAHGYPSDLDDLEWGPWQDRITQQATMGVLDIAPVEHALLPQSVLRLLVSLPEARAALARGDAYRAVYYALHVALRSPELTILREGRARSGQRNRAAAQQTNATRWPHQLDPDKVRRRADELHTQTPTRSKNQIALRLRHEYAALGVKRKTATFRKIIQAPPEK